MDSSTASPLRGRARRAVALTGALVALVGWAAPAAASEARGPVAPLTVANVDDAPDAEIAPLTMELDAGGVATGSSLGVTLQVANSSSEEIAAAAVTVSLGDALDDADAIAAWLDGSADTARDEVESLSTQSLPAGTSQTITGALPLGDIPSGVYPVVAEFDGGEAPVEARGLIIVTGAETPEVGVVVPIAGPVATDGVYTARALATLTGEEGLLTAQLDAVDGTEAILAVDPAIAASIRALGDTAPAEAIEWLDRLLSLENDRFALQFADADVTPQIEAGLDAPLKPTHLGAYLDENIVAASDEPITLHSLTTISPTVRTELFWPTPGSAGDDVVAALADGSDARVIVPASSTTDGAARLGDDALAYDDALSDRLLEIARASDPVVRAQAISAATAEVWLAASESDQPLLLALDRMGSDALTTDSEGATIVDAELEMSAEGLAGAVDAVLSTPALTGATLRDVLDAAHGSVSLSDVPPDEERRAAVEAYLEDEPQIAHISKALENPALFTGQVRAELLRLLSVGWATNPEGFAERSASLAALADDRAVAIDIQQPAPVQLLSPEAPMPVWIRNDLPYPARVTIIATPDDPRLSIDERTEVIAQPDSTTRVSIPIEARVGSGDVTVHFRLEARTGEQIGPNRDMEVTVRADWERIGIGILIALVVGLFGFGIVRQVRRRRRDREQAAANSDDGMKEGDA
ncbi:DUF6049 family protein [Microbacterium karelineae]|uniref:DUF6049 family protein n=1 Tax=Microbacterium karelineae TaxID=2654283 RepID=UPI0012EA1167|nr:DUF6049 family protein [Microbacterium karelineae]